MTASDHCRHCSQECQEQDHRPQHANKGMSAVWEYGACPACLEAERIAADIDRTITPNVSERVQDGLAWAAAIARGKA